MPLFYVVAKTRNTASLLFFIVFILPIDRKGFFIDCNEESYIYSVVADVHVCTGHTSAD